MCQREIKIGDDYEGFVYAEGRSIRVSKNHWFCPDDFWREEDEEAARADAEADRREQEEKSSESEAA